MKFFDKKIFIFGIIFIGLFLWLPVKAVQKQYCVFEYFQKNQFNVCPDTNKMHLLFGQDLGGGYIISSGTCNPTVKAKLFPDSTTESVMCQDKPLSFTVQTCEEGNPPTACTQQGAGYQTGTESPDKLCPKSTTQETCETTNNLSPIFKKCKWAKDVCVDIVSYASLQSKECEKAENKYCTINKACVIFENQCRTYEKLTTEQKQKIQSSGINAANTEKYKPPAISNFLPNCAYPGTCDDINDLLLVFIKIAQFLFKIIGTAAFLFFVYGGFMMVISMGNADRVKQGREALVAAVIGLIIAFSAYTLVDLVLDGLQVSNEYRATGLLDTAKDQKTPPKK